MSVLTEAAWQDPPPAAAARLSQVQLWEHQQVTVRGSPLYEGWGCFQSSREQDRTAEVCSLSVAMLVPGCKQAAGQRVLVSGQLRGMCSGENWSRIADQTAEGEVEGHRNERVQNLSACRSEAVRQIPAEAAARRSVGEGCNESRGRHRKVGGNRRPGYWQ